MEDDRRRLSTALHAASVLVREGRSTEAVGLLRESMREVRDVVSTRLEEPLEHEPLGYGALKVESLEGKSKPSSEHYEMPQFSYLLNLDTDTSSLLTPLHATVLLSFNLAVVFHSQAATDDRNSSAEKAHHMYKLTWGCLRMIDELDERDPLRILILGLSLNSAQLLLELGLKDEAEDHFRYFVHCYVSTAPQLLESMRECRSIFDKMMHGILESISSD